MAATSATVKMRFASIRLYFRILGAKIQETSETDVSLMEINVSNLGILLFLLRNLPILAAGHAVCVAEEA